MTDQIAISFQTRGDNEPFFQMSESIFRKFEINGVKRSKVKMNVEYDLDYQRFVFTFFADRPND